MYGRALEDAFASVLLMAFAAGVVAVLSVIALWYFVLSHLRIGWI